MFRLAQDWSQRQEERFCWAWLPSGKDEITGVPVRCYVATDFKFKVLIKNRSFLVNRFDCIFEYIAT